MATPDFVLELRKHVGNAPLWLGGVTAVVLRGDGSAREVLLVRRADTGEWSAITGIIDPGEEPATTAVREALEEANVEILPDRLVGIDSRDAVTYANGDVASFLNITFRCGYVSGDPLPADGENLEVAWFALDSLPAMADRYRRRIAQAAGDGAEAEFLF
jgi:8-oxo-dGTP pyrophosphatase MutT (NUDIX family)